MTNLVFRRDTCRLCGGRVLELVLHLTPTPVGFDYVPADRLDAVQESYPLDVFLCRSCGYTGLLDVVAPKFLFNDSTQITSRSLGVVQDLRQLADSLVRRVEPPRGSFVVDIGSNDGTLLKFFRGQEMRVLGIEPAGYAADVATGSGIPTVTNFFSTELARTIKDEWGPAKIITANRVIANIDSLADTIEGVRHLMAPDGIFAFETGSLVDMLENNLFDTIYHEHLGYDLVRPLDAFFRRHHMELIDIERTPIKGGSLRGFVQLAGGPWKVSPSVANLMALEARLGMDSAEPFKAFAARLDKAKDELLSLLQDLKARGKTFAGYGASVGSTTMIYHLCIGDILSFLVDDDPRNHGLFSPGLHIPVLSSQALYERKPDYVLILAWRYVEPIVKKHQAYLDQGGHFIVPLPKIEVI